MGGTSVTRWKNVANYMCAALGRFQLQTRLWTVPYLNWENCCEQWLELVLLCNIITVELVCGQIFFRNFWSFPVLVSIVSPFSSSQVHSNMATRSKYIINLQSKSGINLMYWVHGLGPPHCFARCWHSPSKFGWGWGKSCMGHGSQSTEKGNYAEKYGTYPN